MIEWEKLFLWVQFFTSSEQKTPQRAVNVTDTREFDPKGRGEKEDDQLKSL